MVFCSVRRPYILKKTIIIESTDLLHWPPLLVCGVLLGLRGAVGEHDHLLVGALGRREAVEHVPLQGHLADHEQVAGMKEQ